MEAMLGCGVNFAEGREDVEEDVEEVDNDDDDDDDDDDMSFASRTVYLEKKKIKFANVGRC